MIVGAALVSVAPQDASDADVDAAAAAVVVAVAAVAAVAAVVAPAVVKAVPMAAKNGAIRFPRRLTI